MSFFEIAGLIGVVLVAATGSLTQLFPGNGVLVVATGIWAYLTGGSAWWYFAGVALIIAASMVIKYLLPATYMKREGVAYRTMMIGAIAGFIGMFVIPFVGLPIGFVGGIFIAEYLKDSRSAWPRTKVALKGVAGSIIIELIATALASAVWVAGYAIL